MLAQAHNNITDNFDNRTDRLAISGYASLFDQCDMSGDIVRRGAFAASLLSNSFLSGSKSKLPMLFGHETKTPIGVWQRIFEDNTGLFVSGHIILGDKHSERIAKLVLSGALSGLSIGYKTVRARKHNHGRELLEIDLWEVSIVAFPMLRAARITQIDDYSDENINSSRRAV